MNEPIGSSEEHRRNLLAATAAALQVQYLAPVPPTNILITCTAFAPDKANLDVSAYCDPDGVKQLAAVLGVEVTQRPHIATSPDLYTVADAVVIGIPVKIWTLGYASAVQVPAVTS